MTRSSIRRAEMAFFLLVCLIVRPDSIHAEKPAITGLYPSGGQIGQTVEVEVLGKLGTAPVLVWTDQEHITGELSKDKKKLRLTISENAQPGVCWVRVCNNEGASALRPFLVGRLPEVKETEPNQSLDKAQLVNAVGTVINGKLHANGELDTFKVSLKKGQTLVADVVANEVIGSPMDAILQVVSAKGFVLAQEDDSPKFDPRIAIMAPEDGEYFVRVFAFPATPNSSIRYAGGADYVYRLTLTTGPYVHHTDPLAVQKGKPRKMLLKGFNLPPEGAPHEMGSSEENAADAIPFPSVQPFSLPVTEYPNFAEQDQKNGASPFTPPFSITACIAKPDEIDRYQLTCKKGETLFVQVESSALGFPLDPVLEIKDAKGQSIKVVDDKARNVFDAEYRWKVPADGNYQIEITDRFGHGGWDYAYRLIVEQPRPEFQLSLASDAFTITKGKPLEIPVTITRSNGFAEKIEITVKGLPKGITAEAITSEPKGPTAKSVNLKLTAKDNTPFHGPVWIEGQAGNQTSAATNPTIKASHKAQHVWITYQPKK